MPEQERLRKKWAERRNTRRRIALSLRERKRHTEFWYSASKHVWHLIRQRVRWCLAHSQKIVQTGSVRCRQLFQCRAREGRTYLYLFTNNGLVHIPLRSSSAAVASGSAAATTGSIWWMAAALSHSFFSWNFLSCKQQTGNFRRKCFCQKFSRTFLAEISRRNLPCRLTFRFIWIDLAIAGPPIAIKSGMVITTSDHTCVHWI